MYLLIGSSTIKFNLLKVDIINSTCWIFRKGGCVSVDCLNTPSLFAPKAKPLKLQRQLRDEVRKMIWPWYWNTVSIFELWNSFGSQSSCRDLKQQISLIDQLLKVFVFAAVCALSFQVLFHSKASQVPALLVRCHCRCSFIEFVTYKGGDAFFCLAILHFVNYTQFANKTWHCANLWDPLFCFL